MVHGGGGARRRRHDLSQFLETYFQYNTSFSRIGLFLATFLQDHYNLDKHIRFSWKWFWYLNFVSVVKVPFVGVKLWGWYCKLGATQQWVAINLFFCITQECLHTPTPPTPSLLNSHCIWILIMDRGMIMMHTYFQYLYTCNCNIPKYHLTLEGARQKKWESSSRRC